MKILTTPWKKDLLALVADSKTSIRITSPFVKENICRDLIEAKQADPIIELVTSFKLANIFSGFLDLSVLELIISLADLRLSGCFPGFPPRRKAAKYF